MLFKPRRSSPRLRAFDYEGWYAYHVVLTTTNRLPRFRDRRTALDCIDHLLASATHAGFGVLAYCFMPNHAHLLVLGKAEEASLVRFVQRFKQATGHAHPRLWQRGYYDHIVRQEEQLKETARYIWGNPVRAALAADATGYPFSGPREALLGEAGREWRAQDKAEALSRVAGAARGAPVGQASSRGNAEDRAEALSLQTPTRHVGGQGRA